VILSVVEEVPARDHDAGWYHTARIARQRDVGILNCAFCEAQKPSPAHQPGGIGEMVTALSASSTQAMFLTCLGGVGGVAMTCWRIEEFRHVGLGGITGGQIRELEASLYQLQNCRVIHYCVRDVIFFRKWRNHNQRHPEASDKEPQTGLVLLRKCPCLADRSDTRCCLGYGEVRRHVVIEPPPSS